MKKVRLVIFLFPIKAFFVIAIGHTPLFIIGYAGGAPAGVRMVMIQ
jgi:hypothetical protein